MHSMTIAGKTIFITGANRGIGVALVKDALARGAKHVYAGTRQPWTGLENARVTPIMLDVTKEAQVERASAVIGSLDLLINNAGVALPDQLSDRAELDRHRGVNLIGPFSVTQAFLPALTRSKGAIVNVLSIAGIAALPILPAYSISKAAAFSLSQSMRAIFAARGVKVHIVLAGPVDTDMSRGLEVPKASADSVASAIFAGVENRRDEIFPDPTSACLENAWDAGALRGLAQQFAGFLTPTPAES